MLKRIHITIVYLETNTDLIILKTYCEKQNRIRFSQTVQYVQQLAIKDQS